MNSYFSHDSNARNDDKIIALRMKHGMEGYGVYFAILERMREIKDYFHVKDYNVIAFDLRVSNALIKSIVEDFGLFQCAEDGSRFYSESFLKRMKAKDDVSILRAESGKKGAENRWNMANVIQGDGKSMANAIKNDGKESKVKESKVKKSKVKDIEGGDPPSPETESFQKFETWLKANCPNVCKLPQQMTERQFTDIYSRYGTNKICEMFLSMENWKPLTSKNRSVYLTFTKWMRMDSLKTVVNQKDHEERREHIPLQ
jgi:hypothetical protein